MADSGEVFADLVGSSCFNASRDVAGNTTTGKHADMRYGRDPVERSVNALFLAGDGSCDQGMVHFHDLVVAEHGDDGLHGRLVPRHHQASRSVAVQPVRGPDR